jgi:D-amino-acid dehydrogenase
MATVQQAGNAPIAVIGAGVVGTATALTLRRRGHAVTLFDARLPGTATSSGNAALFATGQCLPLAQPGVLRQIPSLLRDPTGPLVLRWRYLPRLLPWLLRFVAASRPQRVAAASQALASLLRPSLDCWLDLLGQQASSLVHRKGVLYVYDDPAKLRAGEADAALRRDYGVRIEKLAAPELRQLEPALKPGLAGGLFHPDYAHAADPLQVVTALADSFVRAGGHLIREEVRGFVFGDDGPNHIATSAAAHPCGRIVLAAGIWSKPLAAALGIRVPLESERGYHMMLPEPGLRLRLPVLYGDHRVALTPLAGGLRVSGTMELAGLAAPPDPRRHAMLLTLAQRLLPALGTGAAKPWMGHRPSTPDSLPVIGRSPHFTNVYFAFGHGHLGLTLGAITARLIAELIEGTAPALDLAPFRPERF